MTLIIRNCPFFERPTSVEIRGEKVQERAYQIIVWARVVAEGVLSPRIPAILDIGHSLNFSISEGQLRDWAGVDVETLKVIGRATLNDPLAPRLPVLGLRALAHNKLYTTIDGNRMSVSIRCGWF